VLNEYNARIAERETQTFSSDTGSSNAPVLTRRRSGGGTARIDHVQLSDVQGRPLQQLDCAEPILIDLWVKTHEALPQLTIGFLIKDRVGQWVYGSNTTLLDYPMPPLPAETRLRFRISLPGQLGEGSYSLSLSLHNGIDHLGSNYDWWDRALTFEVVATVGSRGCGPVRLPTRVEGPMDLQTIRQLGKN